MNKLILYGDSILRGITYSSEAHRHKLCAGYKLPTISSLGIEVINHARMGATITKGFDLLEATLTDDCRGDIVLLEYGGNDCDYNWDAISENPLGTFLPHTPEEKFEATYGQAIELAKARGAQVVLSSLVPIDADRYLSVITQNRSYDNILGWLGDSTMLYRFHEHYNSIVHALAQQHGCALLDIRKEFLLSHNYKKLISADGIHPTDEGHDLIEASIRSYLQNTMHMCA